MQLLNVAKRLGACVVLIGGVILASNPAQAALQTFSVSTDSLNASADFTPSAGSLTIALTDLLTADQVISAGQLVSDISFTVSGGTGSATVSSQTGTLIFLDSNGTVISSTSNAALDWGVSGTGGSYTLTALTGGQPNELIIGGTSTTTSYPNANGSITNQPPNSFQPFIQGTGNYTLAIAGVTSTSTISNVVFSFGTQPETLVPAGVPEPSPIVLALAGLGTLGLVSLRRRWNRPISA
jgi:hypothetical protein